jgi:hypothetical protein
VIRQAVRHKYLSLKSATKGGLDDPGAHPRSPPRLAVPIVVLPFVNSALAARAPFRHASRNCGAKAFVSCSALAASSHTNPTLVATSSTATPGT